MTILTLNAPSGRECEYHVWSDVVSCDDLYITLRSGEKIRKSICAKVELLSVADAPTDYNGFKNFTEALVLEFAKEHGFKAGISTIDIGKKENFDALDLLTHI